MNSHDMPAKRVITAFGSIGKCADSLGIARSTVQGWWERGFVPLDRIDEVRDAAKARGLVLPVHDFLPPKIRQDIVGEDAA